MTGLSPAEQRVADLLPTGATNRQIAHRLGLTEHTVKAHVKAILRKLGAANRYDAALAVRGRADREAAVTLVGIAAEQLRRSRTACVHILATAQRHGLTLEEMHAASGIPRATLTRMLQEGEALGRGLTLRDETAQAGFVARACENEGVDKSRPPGSTVVPATYPGGLASREGAD